MIPDYLAWLLAFLISCCIAAVIMHTLDVIVRIAERIVECIRRYSDERD